MLYHSEMVTESDYGTMEPAAYIIPVSSKEEPREYQAMLPVTSPTAVTAPDQIYSEIAEQKQAAVEQDDKLKATLPNRGKNIKDRLNALLGPKGGDSGRVSLNKLVNRKSTAEKPQVPAKPESSSNNSPTKTDDSPTTPEYPPKATENPYYFAKEAKRTPIETLSDIPAVVNDLTVTEVAKCLELLHLGQYVDEFTSQGVDGTLLAHITEDMMQESFGMKKFEAMKFTRFVNGWRPNDK